MATTLMPTAPAGAPWGYAPRTSTIYSVFPVKTEGKELSWVSGFKMYTMDAAPRDGYSKLVIEDAIQWIRDMSSVGDDNQQGSMAPAPVSAAIRADNLVTFWTSNTLGAKSGYAPGIGVFNGFEGSVEFKDFLATLRTSQEAFFRWLVQDASDKHTKGEAHNISDLHRQAAKWLLDKGAERLPWYPKIEFADVKNCVACDAQIAAKAKKCQECSTDLVDYYTTKFMDPSGDPVIAAEIARIKEHRDKAAKVTPPIQAK